MAAAGVEVRVLATPGHTADSLVFRIGTDDPDPAALTGDTILGQGSTVIAEPDGDLGAYLASLRRLVELGPAHVLPGHGPDLADAGAVAAAYLDHRAERLEQIRAGLAMLGSSPEAGAVPALVALVYRDVPRDLWPAAEQSVRAQLAYLRHAADR